MSAQTAEIEQVESAFNQVAVEEKVFELAQRKAAIYAKSSLVPKEYQNNIGNVLIAENMARRMGADTLMVMQNLYVVHGKPGWSATFLIASFNSNGRFSAIKYRFNGEPNTEDWGCQAYCTEIATGEEIEGTTITWAMAAAEGWVNKQGSKWKTMPEQMFRYRAAAFLIRSTAPEIGMGLLTKEELEDMPTNGKVEAELKPGVAGIKDRLKLVHADEEELAEDTAIEVEPEPADHVDPEIHDERPDEAVEVDDEEAIDGETVDPDESNLIDLRTRVNELLVEKIGGMASDQKKFLRGRIVASEHPEILKEMLADLEAM